MQSSSHDKLSAEMIEAMRVLDAHTIFYRRTSKYQLKIGKFNFWPNTGVITEDDIGRHQESGIDALLALIERRPMRLHIHR